jgi:hypothetical protein
MNLNFSQLIVLILLLSVGLVSGTLLNNGFNGPSVRLAVDVRHPVGLAQDGTGDQCPDKELKGPETIVCFSDIGTRSPTPICAEPKDGADKVNDFRGKDKLDDCSKIVSKSEREKKKGINEARRNELQEKYENRTITDEELYELQDLETAIGIADQTCALSSRIAQMGEGGEPIVICVPENKCKIEGVEKNQTVNELDLDEGDKEKGIRCFVCQSNDKYKCGLKNPVIILDDEENDNPRDGEQPPLPVPDGKRGDRPSDG